MESITIYVTPLLQVLGILALGFFVGILFNLYRITRDAAFVSNKLKQLSDIKGWLEMLKIIGNKKSKKK